ncbi:hypothetical protein PVAP13_6NG268093 [Panicum virgatum]|uniref:Secreted protein n=1 Tax=Panicum virgatum TaxID=38727 RepID=A0A8T0R3Q5_PANVG|nr:hypothetical protein PVAP13_6NG268093 [Panicum virgatum]
MPFQFVVFFCCCVAYAAGSRCCPAAALRRRKPQPLLVRGPAALIRQGTLRSWPLAPEGASPCEESPPVRQRRAADPIRRGESERTVAHEASPVTSCRNGTDGRRRNRFRMLL